MRCLEISKKSYNFLFFQPKISGCMWEYSLKSLVFLCHDCFIIHSFHSFESIHNFHPIINKNYTNENTIYRVEYTHINIVLNIVNQSIDLSLELAQRQGGLRGTMDYFVGRRLRVFHVLEYKRIITRRRQRREEKEEKERGRKSYGRVYRTEARTRVPSRTLRYARNVCLTVRLIEANRAILSVYTRTGVRCATRRDTTRYDISISHTTTCLLILQPRFSILQS